MPKAVAMRPFDVPPLIRTIFGWDFPVMIPRPGYGEFHEGIEVL